MFKNSLSNAGDVGSIPGQGTKSPHAAGYLNANTATTELFARNKRSHEPQLRPDAAKNKQKKKKKRTVTQDVQGPLEGQGVTIPGRGCMSRQNQGKLPGGTSKMRLENERLLWQSREAGGGKGRGLCP